MTRSSSSILHRGCKQHSTDTASITDTRNTVIGTASNVSSENSNAELTSSQTVSATPKQKLSKIGFKHSPSHGTSLSEHYRLVDPAERDALLTGQDCHGVAHKLLAPGEGDDPTPPTPVLVSGGVPPPAGVWEPQSVRAVALAKALSWQRERAVPRALVEYPAAGVVRPVRLTTRKKARYRELLRTVETLDGPPPRLDDDAKCESCEYRETCGVKSRSLRSLLGL
jgi:hypothetical protein